MKYRITTGDGQELSVLMPNQNILSSKLEQTWFSGSKIYLYRNNTNLLLIAKYAGCFNKKLEIIFQDNDIVKHMQIKHATLIVDDEYKVTLSRNISPFKTYAKIFYNKEKIGVLKTNIFSNKKIYDLNIYNSLEELEFYVVLLVLICETTRMAEDT